MATVKFDWIELALGTPSNRGVPECKSNLLSYIKKANNGGFPNGFDLYRSMYLYPKDAIPDVKKFKPKDYFGVRDIDWIILDVDKGRNSDEYTYDKVIALLDTLTSLGLTEDNWLIYFSGTGYNIHVPNTAFGFKPSTHLPVEVKDTLDKLFGQLIDTTIFGHVSLYRVPLTRNHKSNLYKVPILTKEFKRMNISHIKDYAKSLSNVDLSAIVTPVGDLELNGHIVERRTKPVAKVQYHARVTEPLQEATCVQKIYNRGPQQGNRHHSLLRMASHYRRKGLPSTAAKAALLDWNNGELNEADVNKTVEGVYNRGYQFGCQDKLLAELCDPICKYYKDKSYLSTIKNVDEMQLELEKYATTDFSGKTLHLGAMLGLSSGLNVYPGELVSIYGPTGCNKTTFAQNIALGYCMATDSIIERFQMDTLFLSLELSAAEMHKRNLSIVSGESPHNILRDIAGNKVLFAKHKHQLTHMKVSTLSLSIESVIENVMRFKPKLLVIDYLDLVKSSRRGEYERLNDICHKLRNLATNQGIIVIQLAQISRSAGRDESGKVRDLNVNSGKGSGAIENSSSKVISINGEQSSRIRRIRMHKNSDGPLFTISLRLEDSLRLRRDFEDEGTPEEPNDGIIRPKTREGQECLLQEN